LLPPCASPEEDRMLPQVVCCTLLSARLTARERVVRGHEAMTALAFSSLSLSRLASPHCTIL
jgi:hypothetical protein